MGRVYIESTNHYTSDAKPNALDHKICLCCGLMTSQLLCVILCHLLKRGRKGREEIVKRKERDTKETKRKSNDREETEAPHQVSYLLETV